MLTNRQTLGELQTPPVVPTLAQQPTPSLLPGPILDEAALHGVLGDFVRLVAPHSETDPAAVLVQALSAFSAYCARSPYVAVEGDRHYSNLFALVVGESSKSRKGTSWGWVRRLLKDVNNVQAIRSGLASGEGLKFAVRDGAGDDVGVQDKRLTILETEFAQVLRVAQRAGNTLSTTIREVWDSGTYGILTRSAPVQVTDAHISIIGHITREELTKELTRLDAASGFGNRFLYVFARRSKLLPFGGEGVNEAEIQTIRGRIERAAETAASRREVTMTESARVMWVAIYEKLAESKSGLVGSLTARSEAHVLRLALNYALLDESEQIDDGHLEAAVALWEYCEQSVDVIFGKASGDPVLERVRKLLNDVGPYGMARTELMDAFSGHLPAASFDGVLQTLERNGEALRIAVPTAGRPAERWVSVSQLHRGRC